MKNIVLYLSKHENSFYPLRLISSEFFLPYWDLFSSKKLSENESHLIQDSARKSIEYSMNGESIYWNMDFSESNARATWEKFYHLLSDGESDIQSYATGLVFQFLVSQQDSMNNDYFINMITRLRFDKKYRRELAYDDSDAEILDVIYEQTFESILSKDDIKIGWINSNAHWDKKLKNQTPDFPESVYIIFSMAYDARSNIPLLRENIDLFFGNATTDKNEFLSRLKKAHKESSTHLEDITFPLVFSLGDG